MNVNELTTRHYREHRQTLKEFFWWCLDNRPELNHGDEDDVDDAINAFVGSHILPIDEDEE